MQLDPGLLAAIIANPDDDLPRLQMADWLDERGGCERAEFIRVQVELSRTREPELKSMGVIGDHDESRRNACSGCRKRPPGTDCRWCVLRARERELLKAIPVPGRLLTNETVWIADLILPVMGDGQPNDGRVFRWDWSRGFVSAITCTAHDWLRHADAITAATPLERVMLTTWPGPPRFGLGSKPVLEILSECWPGITFTLPTARPGTRVATLAGRDVRPGDMLYANDDGTVRAI